MRRAWFIWFRSLPAGNPSRPRLPSMHPSPPGTARTSGSIRRCRRARDLSRASHPLCFSRPFTVKRLNRNVCQYGIAAVAMGRQKLTLFQPSSAQVAPFHLSYLRSCLSRASSAHLVAGLAGYRLLPIQRRSGRVAARLGGGRPLRGAEQVALATVEPASGHENTRPASHESPCLQGKPVPLSGKSSGGNSAVTGQENTHALIPVGRERAFTPG